MSNVAEPKLGEPDARVKYVPRVRWRVNVGGLELVLSALGPCATWRCGEEWWPVTVGEA